MAKPMKNRVVRVSDEVWESAQAQAKVEHQDLSYVIRMFLHKYGSPQREHESVRCLIPVARDREADTSDDYIAREATSALERMAANSNRTLVGEPKLLERQGTAYFIDNDGNTVTMSGSVGYLYESDTIPRP